ncbi:hypothetical protein HMI54_015290 [Coelomomyces lativittatus]|nr:hypothetical protein HMI56_005192 [Coelomomyces lativittatus]KAJ1512716.1 hypothetical protein HMI55_006130 [Coelomomyces lativittatus]KAJ1513011.1 hypothetical protein HMI54_015290 [Coelomomyces lativittatus]
MTSSFPLLSSSSSTSSSECHSLSEYATQPDFTPTSSCILCCQCGTPIQPNPAALCLPCLSQTIDLTERIPKQAIVHFCRHCGRYLNPPSQWIHASLESKELLALLVKRLRGLHQVQLKEAGFLWTEPHSKRIKVKLSIQKEIFLGMQLHQTFTVEYTVANQQCDQCTRVMAEQTWRAQVQIRQKRVHPRTFFYFEQLVLQHKWHAHTTQLKPVKDGMDFFYQHRTHAHHLANAIQARLPATIKFSEQLISTDQQNSTTNTRYTIAVELLPICKEDLLCLTQKQNQALGGVGPLMVCYKIHSGIALIQPWTLATLDISVKQYVRMTPLLTPVAMASQLIEFYVLEVEWTGIEQGPNRLAYVHVARSSDHHEFTVRSHLGHVLKPGDTVLGYDFTTLNINHDAFEVYMNSGQCEDVLIVKKTYPKRSSLKPRPWKLKSLQLTEPLTLPSNPNENPNPTVHGKSKSSLINAWDKTLHAEEYELFLQELEEDPEIRAQVQVYKNKEVLDQLTEYLQSHPNPTTLTSLGMEDEETGRPEIPLEELLEDLDLEDDNHDERPQTVLLEESHESESEMVMEEDPPSIQLG